MLLVGNPGVGKTTLIRALGQRLLGEGWIVFEASAADVLAGQIYIGQIEERVQTIARTLGGHKILWIVENFSELLWSGRHQFNPQGLLGLLLPHLADRTIRLVGECRPDTYHALIEMQPKVGSALAAYRMSPLSDEATLSLGSFWAAQHRLSDGAEFVTPSVIREALHLVKHYLSDKAAPGNLLDFLKLVRHRPIEERGPALSRVSPDDLLAALSHLTGLPRSMLDERTTLDLENLRRFFNQRVLGQPEAVECLVERLAMIKAGLTDPTRPQGVFLFVGPTGTGKTEIAKALAEFLFGSSSRMIRLDMSEFQLPESLDRLVGNGGTALVDAICKQPFSVILLDEFEKSHPRVWDLFLQLFDDGRLTDRHGRTADFRHSIAIMTSNLGAAIPPGTNIGFAQGKGTFNPGGVERAVSQVFRAEFINRIDRIVIFRPLTQSVMRELLQKEFTEIVGRRGLRTRPWAVEWDQSAIEFLIEKGFTPDLGARPLKRAIERYVLAPLAMAIVNREVPQGDQFLFIRSNGERIEACFVNPDEPESEQADTPALTPAFQRVEELVLNAYGTQEEVAFLKAEYEHLVEQLRADEWQNRKQAALREIGSPGFWDLPNRYGVLGLVEYMDRIEAGLETAGSLLGRLTRSRPISRGSHIPKDLVQHLACQIYLLRAAYSALFEGRPRDAFLSVTALRDAGVDRAASDDFARRIGVMYRNWAKARRMRCEVLEEVEGQESTPYRLVLAISGFAAYCILEAESGLHVLETSENDGSLGRSRARVCVVAQPDEPARLENGSLRRQAIRALERDRAANNVIVRRYRSDPSPLVRDRVRGWRTGRLDDVLDGNFDVIQ